ncbi:hypothetical protein D037_4855B, partial [Vibrio parahaemolyticus IDH02640]
GIFTTGVDLNQHLQWFEFLRTLLIESLCDLSAINGVNPIEMFSNKSRFIRLNRANEVPFDSIIWIMLGKVLNFTDAFLDVVFTKRGLSRLVGFENCLDRFSFAYR